ncbi:hypothetical protein CVIRNUC_000408 [Coccomyxa viridis]|uniref:CUE domain-containing protein n=1 Tax=Coccomyxa viridis TaxID=1274662 RepID=A0AAV1HU79_9CHLO|nr:hypothetical protein CVIRNUC_000408 [Coccomyxa viridis]
MASRANALSMLKDMFPTIPTETIAAVLENHDGDIEGSIEALLSVCSPALGSDKGLQAPSPVSQSANDQVWRDEELARALQAQLNAETSTRSAPGWLLSEGREAQSPSAARDVSWAQGEDDPLKEWRDMANSVGQTVAEGLTSFADSVSSWLSGPLDGELEPETPSRRAASASEAGKHEEEDTVVVAGDAERHMAAHRRTSSRSLEDCNIHRSSSGVPQGEDNGVMRSGDNKKDK